MPADEHFSTAKTNTWKKIIFRKCLNCFYFFCKYFSNNPRGFMVQIFHKNAPGLEGHVPPLKFWNLGQVNLNSFEFQNRAKYEIDSKLNIFRNFQIHFSNTLFEEVMSSSLHDLNWMNLNSKANRESHFIPSHSKVSKSFKFHSIQSHNQTINHSIY